MNFISLFKRNLIYNLKKKISLDTDNVNFESLDSLFYYYGSDKADFFNKTGKKSHGFSHFYEAKLNSFKKKKINILEIGSFAGSSAAAFVKYIPEANVFCFDANISNIKYKSKKIHVYGLDINNEKKVKKTINNIFSQHKINEFDLIIDDGSHNLSDILIGIKFFFQLVKKNGLFVIEDFKHPNYYEYNNNVNHILIDELLKNLEKKNTFSSNILTENDQLNLINSVRKIEIFKGNLNDSDICFITKS